MVDTLKAHFFRWGWLVPTALPLAEIGGRGLFNIIFYLYFIWAVFAGALIPKITKMQWMLYAGMIIAFGLSIIPMHEGAAASLIKLLKYVAHTSVFFITLHVLQKRSLGIDVVMRRLAITALIVIGLLSMMLIFHSFDPDVKVRYTDTAPWLLAFVCGYCINNFPRWRGFGIMALSLSLVILYAFVSDGRTGLMAGLMAVSVCCLIYFRVNFLKLLGGALLAISLIWVLDPNFNRGADLNKGVWGYLDRFSSGRTILWRQAINTPPPIPMLGVGFYNSDGKAAVTGISFNGELGQQVKHLHNVFLDCWYETGFLGLSFFLAWLGYHFLQLAKLIRQEDKQRKLQIAVLTATTAALMVEGILTHSNTSRLLSIYLFVVFALVIQMRDNQNSFQGT